MTAATWVALGAAVAIGAPARLPARIGALAGDGRLVGRPAKRRRFDAAALPWPRLALAAAIGVLAGASMAGAALLGIAAAAGCAAGYVLIGDLVAGRAAARRRAHLLAALRVLVGELEAGARPVAALAAAGAAGPAVESVFAAAAGAAAAGDDAGAVLADEPATRAIGLAWQLGEDTGVALAGVLARVAADFAASDEQRRTVAVALAGPRSSAFVLSGLPLLGIGLGAAMGARPWSFLLGAGPGRAVCCVGVLLDVAGLLWMRHILRRAELP